MIDEKQLDILEALALGFSPITGEVLGENSIVRDASVVSALREIVDKLKNKSADLSDEINISENQISVVVELFKSCNVTVTANRLASFMLGLKKFKNQLITSHELFSKYDGIYKLGQLSDYFTEYLSKMSQGNNYSEYKHKDQDALKKIDFFQKPVFNTLTQTDIKQIKNKVREIDFKKADNLSDYIIKARIRYPRAYEPWTAYEVDLLKQAIVQTNELEILSTCFQRGGGSLESRGKKIIFESQSVCIEESKSDLSDLNEKQKQAVVSENKRVLVLAGAGSGKTKTLLKKLVYLVEKKEVSPTNILAITFTKNAANEMLDRLIMADDETGEYEKIIHNKSLSTKEKQVERSKYSKKQKLVSNITLRTFHSLCYNILRNFGVNEFDNQFKIINEDSQNEKTKHSASETAYDVLEKLIIKNCESPDYLLHLQSYVLDYLVDEPPKKSTPLKFHDGKIYTSLDGVKVRSKSERYIANWLFRHNIKYEYEPVVNFKDFDFRPDFFIPEANLYIEHISNLSYPTAAKVKQFKIANVLLAKTFEHDYNDTNLFNQILQNIVKNRLPSDYSFNSAITYKEEFKSYRKEVKIFLNLIISLIKLIKVDNISLEDILAKSQLDKHARVRRFYKLAIPIVQQYQEYCTNKSYLDFNDLITKTIDLFNNQPEIAEKFRNQYKHILIDEFQDVNNLQVDLIKLLIHEDNHLFCVGDDWQSIYGFRGANVDYIVNFNEHFENTEIVKLKVNYRSTNDIVEASNELIKHNKFKVSKDIESNNKSSIKINVYSGVEIEDNIDFAVKQVLKLKEEGYSKDDILFLYRRTDMFKPYSDRFFKEKIKVSGKTIHASKGLEAKAVFILGLTDGRGGFPNVWLADRIFQVVKKSKLDLMLEEERRLFYVAITRAQQDLFLLTEKDNESSFIRELPESNLVRLIVTEGEEVN